MFGMAGEQGFEPWLAESESRLRTIVLTLTHLYS